MMSIGFRPTVNGKVRVTEVNIFDFDKGSKFLHYRPRYLILNAVEFDHADIFKNFEDYAQSFRRLLRMIPGNGLVTANQDDPGVRDVLKDYKFSPVEWFGSRK